MPGFHISPLLIYSLLCSLQKQYQSQGFKACFFVVVVFNRNIKSGHVCCIAFYSNDALFQLQVGELKSVWASHSRRVTWILNGSSNSVRSSYAFKLSFKDLKSLQSGICAFSCKSWARIMQVHLSQEKKMAQLQKGRCAKLCCSRAWYSKHIRFSEPSCIFSVFVLVWPEKAFLMAFHSHDIMLSPSHLARRGLSLLGFISLSV